MVSTLDEHWFDKQTSAAEPQENGCTPMMKGCGALAAVFLAGTVAAVYVISKTPHAGFPLEPAPVSSGTYVK